MIVAALRRVLAVAAATLLALVVLNPQTARGAGPDWSMTMFSDHEDWIGLGQQRALHPGNAAIELGSAPGQIGVEIDPDDDDAFGASFMAPSGDELAVGRYDGAVRSTSNAPGRPFIGVTGDGRGCNVIAGSFEIKELVRGPRDEIERLWLTYEQHCEGDQNALFGEVRFGMPAEPGDGGTLSKLVRWPRLEVGRQGTRVPIVFVAERATSIDSATLSGPGEASFASHDECSGVALAVGESCTVWVRPDRPASAGTLEAALTFAEAGGATHVVALEAPVAATLTELQMVSDEGDWVGQGGSFRWGNEDHWFHAEADASAIAVEVGQFDVSTGWQSIFTAPAGAVIGPGHYEGAVKYAYPYGTAPGLASMGGFSCAAIIGHYTVHELRFDEWGDVAAVDVTFTQHCNGARPALRGSLRFQASDRAPRDLTPPVAQLPRDPVVTPSEPAARRDRVVVPRRSPRSRPIAQRRAPATQPRAVDPVLALAAQRTICVDRSFARASIVAGTRDADRLAGGRNGELLLGLAGADALLGAAGADCLDGGPGADVVRGGRGADVLRGGAGPDVLIGGPGRDLLLCGLGRDVARASGGDATRGCERVVRVDG